MIEYTRHAVRFLVVTGLQQQFRQKEAFWRKRVTQFPTEPCIWHD
jgi:hypothetical protein